MFTFESINVGTDTVFKRLFTIKWVPSSKTLMRTMSLEPQSWRTTVLKSCLGSEVTWSLHGESTQLSFTASEIHWAPYHLLFTFPMHALRKPLVCVFVGWGVSGRAGGGLVMKREYSWWCILLSWGWMVKRSNNYSWIQSSNQPAGSRQLFLWPVPFIGARAPFVFPMKWGLQCAAWQC